MTIGSWVDETPIGLPRTNAEQRRRAARRVASAAPSALEAAELLDALGLTACDGLRAPETHAPPHILHKIH